MSIPKYIIITTFPKNGTKNIGDKLIEFSTKKIIEDLKGKCKFITYWRGEDLTPYLGEINSADALIFACLAIRDNMFPETYKLIDDLEKITIPMVCLASGTSISPNILEADPVANFTNYSENDKKKLMLIASSWKNVSCRGNITYNHLKSVGIDNVSMTGDIAFYDPRFDELSFSKNTNVSAIAVSTPHHPHLYADHFYKLISSLREEYKNSKITLFIHGESLWLNHILINKLDIEVQNIYLEDIRSLDQYENYDIHIGYRVHAHVSALKRRIPSYLFAIDGRGYDYGSTLRLGSTFKAWKVTSNFKRMIFYKTRLWSRKLKNKKTPNIMLPIEVNYEIIDYVLDLIKRDQEEGFIRFIGFENEILNTVHRLKLFLKEL